MSQGNLVKTIIFIAVAAFSVALAAFIRPSNFREPVPAVGDRLFSDLDELSDLHSMEIVFYDKSKKKPAALIIALNNDGEWRLDSHKDYPADADDAEKTIHTAALLLKDLKTLGVATELKSEHAYFGVVEPDLDDSDQSDIGLGILIRVKNANDKEVARLIIGKSVKKTNPDDSTLHFVRVPGQNRVFTALIDPSKFPTEFDKWIKGNLLDLNTSDIRQVEFRDYSFSKQQFSTPLGVMESADEVYSPRYTISLDWNQSDWKWSLASYVEYRNGRAYPTKLLEDEEVNSSKLSDMKNALNDVEIINVESKPKGLRADLHIDDELLRNQSLVSLLQEKGLYPRRVPNDEGGFDRQMLSSDGEVRIGTKEGVEYILRFGKPAGITKKDGETKLNRYLLVSAAFKQDLIPAPEYEDQPEPPANKESGKSPDDPAPPKGNGESNDKPKANDGERQPGNEDTGKESSPKTGESQNKDEATEDKKQEDNAGEKSSPKTDEPQKKNEVTKDTKQEEDAGEKSPPKTDESQNKDEASDDKKQEDNSGEKSPPKTDEPQNKDEVTEDTEQEEYEKEKKRIEADNNNKKVEYEKTIEKGKKRVEELNDRFGNWYYVISEDVYKKIRLGRYDIVQEKDDAEGFGIDDFRDIQEEGVEKEEKKDDPMSPLHPGFPSFPSGS